MVKHNFKFIDLFSGIGGFHLGLSKIGGKCVFASDIDEIANYTYLENFKIQPHGDIKKINTEEIPYFDLLCAGFPCQPFSQIGPKGGLKDERGELIFDVFRILKDKEPKSFILENVKHLLKHNNGITFQIIKSNLEALNYKISYQILEACDYGLPQIRKRLFIIGVHNNIKTEFIFPTNEKLNFSLSDALGGKTDRDLAYTIRIGGRHSGISNKYNWDCYKVNGDLHYLNPNECLILQGFPKNFKLSGNTNNQYKQVGNSVPVNVVSAIGKQLIKLSIL